MNSRNARFIGFSSEHSNGSQFVLADGSVRFISETVEAKTYSNLARKDDGQVLGEF